MATTALVPGNKRKVLGGGYTYKVFGAFVTSAVTQKIAIPFNRVTGYFANYYGTVTASDGPLTLAEVLSNGIIPANSDGTVTVTRPSGGASAAQFIITLTGY